MTDPQPPVEPMVVLVRDGDTVEGVKAALDLLVKYELLDEPPAGWVLIPAGQYVRVAGRAERMTFAMAESMAGPKTAFDQLLTQTAARHGVIPPKLASFLGREPKG